MGIKCILMPSEEQVNDALKDAIDADTVHIEFEVPQDFDTNMQKYADLMLEKFYGAVPITCVLPAMDFTTQGGGYSGRKFVFDVTWVVRRNSEYPIAVVGTAYTPGFMKAVFMSLVSAEYSLLMGFDQQCLMRCVSGACTDTSQCDIPFESVNKEVLRQLVAKAISETQYEVGIKQVAEQLQTKPQQQPESAQPPAQPAQQAQALQQEVVPQQQVTAAQQPTQQQAPQQAAPQPQSQLQLQPQPQQIVRYVEVLPGVMVEEQYTKYFILDAIRHELDKLARTDPNAYSIAKLALPRLMILYTQFVEKNYPGLPDAVKIYIATNSLLRHIMKIAYEQQ